jgi:hypothetical protein
VRVSVPNQETEMHEHKKTHFHPSPHNLSIDRDIATTQLQALDSSFGEVLA